MANFNRTESEKEENQTDLSSKDSTAPNDSCALHIDESNSDDRDSSKDESNTDDEHNTTKQLQFDVTGSDQCNDFLLPVVFW